MGRHSRSQSDRFGPALAALGPALAGLGPILTKLGQPWRSFWPMGTQLGQTLAGLGSRRASITQQMRRGLFFGPF